MKNSLDSSVIPKRGWRIFCGMAFGIVTDSETLCDDEAIDLSLLKLI